MKTLHIIGTIDISSGGPSRSVPQTCEYLSHLGVKIEIITRHSPNPIEVNTNANYSVTFRTLLGLLVYAYRLHPKEIALIHLQHVWDPYIHVMAVAARLKGIPYIITPRGMLEPWIMKRHPRRKKLAMWLYQRRDIAKAVCIHATCEAEKESIRALGFNNPIAVIPNGVNFSAIPTIPKGPSEQKIVFLSRIHPKKGIELLLEAWQEMQLPDWTLEIAGDGEPDYIAQLEKQVECDQIANVHFVGSQYGMDKWEFLSSADVMILPTYSENFGIVVAEALAMGIPVITTKSAPWQELETANCGWWIELSTANIVKTIIKATNCSYQERELMGLKGRRLVEQQYNIAMVAKKIATMYQWVHNKGTLPHFMCERDVETAYSRMKILHFITGIDKTAGGTTAYMQLLSHELNNTLDLVVVAGTSLNPVTLEGIKLHMVNISMCRWWSVVKEFENILTAEKPDVVHINGIWNPQCWLFQRLAQQQCIRVVLSPHGMLEPYILQRHPLKKKLALAVYQHRALSSVNYYHATAQQELDQIRSLGYTQPAQIIANGIDTKDILSKMEWLEVRNILFLSRVHPKKGVELLVEAVAMLPANKLIITIAGEGDANYVEKLKQLAAKKKVAHQFRFVGGVYGNKKWELYQQSDLFILPTYSENFGIVVPEALYTGLPVITTTGTPWHELKTMSCGWWIELSVDNLVAALSEAINLTADELKTMGLRGRQLVTDKFEIKKVAHDMVKMYENIKIRPL